MSGRPATANIIPGRAAISVGDPQLPLASGWVWCRLSDVARLESGHTPSREHPEYWDGPIPWIGIRDAREHDGATISDTIQTVTQDGIDNSAARVLPPGTVCLSRTASVGYTVVMGRQMATSQDFVNWVCSPALEPRYLQYALMAEGPEGLRRFGEGSTHTTIYYPEVKAFHMALAPVNEQRRIVAKLDELRARSRKAREALDEVPALLDKLKQSVLAAAFRGDLTAEWRAAQPPGSVEPASVLLDRIRVERRTRWEQANPKKKYKDPEPVDPDGLPDLPEGWCWARWGELSEWVTYGFTRPMPHVDSGVPIVTAKNVTGGRLDLSTVHFTTQEAFDALSDKDRPEPGDILITKDGTIGRAAVVPSGEPFCINQSVAVVYLRSCPIERAYLLAAIMAPLTQRPILEAARGMAIQHLSITDFARLPVPIAPGPETRVLVGLLDKIERSQAVLRHGLGGAAANLDSLDQSILAKAFRGELVPQDPSDEPAETLLARIEAAASSSGGQKGGRRRKAEGATT